MRAYPRHQIVKYCLPLLLLLSLCANVQALSPAEAAEQAKIQTGGKVLRVKSLGDNHYKVKVLMPNGQVRSLSIRSPDEKNNDSSSSNDQ